MPPEDKRCALVVLRPTIVIKGRGKSLRLERSRRMKGQPKLQSEADSATGEQNLSTIDIVSRIIAFIISIIKR